MERRVFVTVLAGGMAWAALARAQGPGGPGGRGPRRGMRWDQQAEQEFGMGRGMGRQLMTEEEWKEHQEKMRTLSPEERTRYRDEMHVKLAARAKDKGLTLPPAPGGPRRGPGPAPRP